MSGGRPGDRPDEHRSEIRSTLELFEALPLDDDVLTDRLHSIGADATDGARLRAANRQARLLADLEAPAIPAGLDSTRFLAELHESVTTDVESRLRKHPDGDLLAAGLAPVEAPRDVDWTGTDPGAAVPEVLASLEGRAAPGWLWQRIRRDLHQHRAESKPTIRLARKALLGPRLARAGLLAATVTVSAILLESQLSDGRPDPGEPDPRVVRIKASAPIAPDRSAAALVRRFHDGR